MIPAILYMSKRKIYGKNKKGNYWYGARDLIEGKKYYVAIKSKEIYDRYILMIPFDAVSNKAYMHEDLGNILNMNACICAYLSKYALRPQKYALCPQKIALCSQFLVELPKRNIISIDPPGCKDIDDAFSWKQKEDFFVYVYIADVNYQLSIISDNDLITAISKQVCSIYPGTSRVLNMIPDNLMRLCSLVADGQAKRVVKFKFKVINNDLLLVSVSRKAVVISANLVYDCNKIDDVLMRKLSVQNHHDLIEKLMIGVNSQIWNYCNRITIFKEHVIPKQSTYVMNADNKIYHSGLQRYNYVSITSPLRRWPDIIAMSQLFDDGIINDDIINIDEINAKMHACKQFYSDLDVIQLITVLDNNGGTLTEVTIKIVNMRLYLSDYNIKIYNKYIPNVADDVIKCDIYLLKGHNIYSRLKFVIL